MATDYRQLCIELFGTDDVSKLRQISKKLGCGRKKALSKTDTGKAVEMQKQGMSVGEIAQHFSVSRQTISKYLNTPPDEKYSLRLDFMFRQKVCTEIYVDFLNKKISVINRTDDIIKRAFGVKEDPTWTDFEEFIGSRCFPESRANKKDIINKLGLPFYEPLNIIEKTKGRMAEDNQYINITKLKRGDGYEYS